MQLNKTSFESVTTFGGKSQKEIHCCFVLSVRMEEEQETKVGEVKRMIKRVMEKKRRCEGGD